MHQFNSLQLQIHRLSICLTRSSLYAYLRHTASFIEDPIDTKELKNDIFNVSFLHLPWRLWLTVTANQTRTPDQI